VTPLSRLVENPGRLVMPDAEAAQAARQRRVDEAHAIRTRVPPFARARGLKDLATCVEKTRAAGAANGAGARLLAAVRGWTWGASGLFLLGPTKCGKSTVAAMLFRAMLARGVEFGGGDWDRATTLRWFFAPDLASSRREHPLGQGEAPEVLQACAASLLVVDDAGWDQDPRVVSEIFHHRYESKLPTIVTSGRNREELSAHYAAAPIRKMMESNGKISNIVEVFA
jgi:DNA replication protein DnaC